MSNSILVVGGGFSGITAALEAAEVGYEVFIVEKSPYLGGRVAQLTKYFPKLCPPSCGLEIQFQRIKKNPNVKFFTQAEVVSVSGSKGAYTVKVRISPRYTAAHSANLAPLADKLESTVENDFNFGLDTKKPLFMDMPFAFPHRWVLDKSALTEEETNMLHVDPSIDLDEKVKEIELNVGSIVIATGWKPYDASKLTNLGASQIKNCISNMQMERLASPTGPTKGKIQRPSDSSAPRNIAFVQCAGSRDQNHLNFCSYICCMASLKQATYVREQYPDAEVTIYYIDLRTPERYDKFMRKVRADEKVKFVKGKVAGVAEETNGDITIEVEDAVRGIKKKVRHDLVVLATGMQPSIAGCKLPIDVPVDEDGFIIGGEEKGIFAAGCAKKPLDVMKSAQSATGAAMKAIETVRGR